MSDIQVFEAERREWVKRLRASKTFGRGSCTSVDEAHTDDELLESLADFDTYEEAWDLFCEVEEIFWEHQGMSWKRGKD